MKCCICGKKIENYGNNAFPVKDGKYCDICNEMVVAPARISKIRNLDKEVEVGDYLTILCVDNGDSSIDDNARYRNKSGFVTHIDSTGQIFGTWGGIALIPGNDTFEVRNKGVYSKNL